jgi:hypothetical protein
MATGLPRTLRRAGFQVAVLSRDDSHIRRSGHVDRFFSYSFHALLPLDVLRAIRTWRPDIVAPCDDDSVEVLCRIARDIARDRRFLVPPPAQDVVFRSLGPAHGFALKCDRLAALETLSRVGVRTPPFAPVRSSADVAAFGDRHGFPLVLKTDGTAAGAGVRICGTAAEAEAAHRELSRTTGAEAARRSRPAAVDRFLFGRATAPAPRMHAQGFVRGREAMRLFLAADGREICGVSASKVVRSNEGLGPATVVELIDHPEMAAATRAFAAAAEYAGLGSMDFLVEEGSGNAYAIEVNARLTALVHLGPLAGVDFGGRWLHALRDGPHPEGRYRPGARVALFPREWLRDPASPHLRECYVDAPLDDPALLQAMVEHAQRLAPGHGPLDLGAMRTDPFAARPGGDAPA